MRNRQALRVVGAVPAALRVTSLASNQHVWGDGREQPVILRNGLGGQAELKG